MARSVQAGPLNLGVMMAFNRCVANGRWSSRARFGIPCGLLGIFGVACGANPEGAPPEVSVESRVLFEDVNDDGVRLMVLELAENRLGVVFSGPIERPLPDVPGSSLVDAYHALRPDAIEVPGALMEANERAELMREGALEAAAERVAEPEPLVSKSASSFNQAVCKTFKEGDYQYVPLVCKYGYEGVAYTHWGSSVDHFRYYDRSYAWNNSPKEGGVDWVSFYGPDQPQPYVHYFTPKVAPYTQLWASVYGPNSVDTFTAGFIVVGYQAFDMGITAHWRKYIIR
ncbi:MAG TPA: hypothetical protein VGK73_30815 [Polyangiaceae bacterium]